MNLQERNDDIEAMNKAFFAEKWVECQRLSNKLSPDLEGNPTFLMMSGIAEFNMGNLNDAKLHLQKLNLVDPTGQKPKKLLAFIHGELEEFNEGVACLQGMDDDEALFMLGNYYIQVNAHAAAVLTFEKIPHNPKTKILLGKACKESGLPRRAESLFIELLEQGAEQAEWATMWLGEILIQEQRWAELERIMVPAVRVPQCAIAARAVLAEVCLMFDRLDQAALWLPSDERSNWGHAFSMQAITKLRLSLRQGAVDNIARRPHPFPNSEIGVACSSLNRSGRFAHQVGDYLCLRYYADRYGIPLETPDWVGHYVFDLNDPLPSSGRRPIRCTGSWLQSQVISSGAMALAGYDFHSVGLLDPIEPKHVIKAREVLRIREHWKALFDPMLNALRAKGQTVVCIHMRLTDRSTGAPPIEWYLEWLHAIWKILSQPVLYIASDDLDSAVSAFTAFHPVTLNHVAQPLTGLEWLQDFYVLMNSDIVAGSIGGFCTLANMLNVKGSQFYRPDASKRGLVEYSPLKDS